MVRYSAFFLAFLSACADGDGGPGGDVTLPPSQATQDNRNATIGRDAMNTVGTSPITAGAGGSAASTVESDISPSIAVARDRASSGVTSANAPNDSQAECPEGSTECSPNPEE